MARFFVNKDAICEDKIIITDADAHHIARSLRMAEGDCITVCDGLGTEYICTLTRIRDTECECRIDKVADGGTESPVSLTLCMAYPKGDKLETVIQKAVELGADRIIPFESSRCIKRPKAEKVDKQLSRLQRIAEEAAKQCGRAKIPSVSLPLSYSDMLKEAKEAEITLICYENEDGRTLKDALPDRTPASISVIVGSEGGFSAEEVFAAVNAGAQSVSLGKRILRCETAPSFVLASISFKYEI